MQKDMSSAWATTVSQLESLIASINPVPELPTRAVTTHVAGQYMLNRMRYSSVSEMSRAWTIYIYMHAVFHLCKGHREHAAEADRDA
jgi:hypothetical protein